MASEQAGSLSEIQNLMRDTSVSPATSVIGVMAKNASSGWQYLSAANNYLLVSGSFSTTGISANQQISAQLLGGTAFIGDVSSLSPDASLFRVSAIGSILSANQQISAQLLGGTAFIGDVSALSPDAGLFRISSFPDSGSISAKSGDANQLHVSSVQGDAGLQHVSSYFGVDTTGQWSIGRLSNLSSSGNVKSSAGVIYGYYAYNTTTIPAYINFTNTSGAINVGTDSVLLKVMLPASAAANVGFPGGLKGFTAGIGVYGVSSILDASSSPVATSAVGINVFYN